MIQTLLSRRSVKIKHLATPAPSAPELQQILTAAMRVPDHGKLAPWRIKVMQGKGLEAFADLVAKRFAELNPDANEKQVQHERARIAGVPMLITVVYTPVFGRIPEWEQQLSTGAVCMNVLHAATALGYAGCWLTEWLAFDPEIKAALGGTLEDKVAGFIYLGTATEPPEERVRPVYNEVVSEWGTS